MVSFRSIVRVWALVTLVAGAGTAFGAEPATADALREQFPPASIDSTAKADAALAATIGAKARVEKDFKAAAQACLGKVLVNECLDRERAERRAHLADIETIELEANRQKRRDKAERTEADREKRDADRTAHASADAEQRVRNRKSYEDKQAEAARAAQSEARRAAVAAKPHKPAVRLGAPGHAPDEAKREKNAASYENHVQEADQHQQVIARRLVEKAAERKRRADAKAAKEAKDAKVAQAARDAAGVAPPASPTAGARP